jgi:hypothetical protein
MKVFRGESCLSTRWRCEVIFALRTLVFSDLQLAHNPFCTYKRTEMNQNLNGLCLEQKCFQLSVVPLNGTDQSF